MKEVCWETQEKKKKNPFFYSHRDQINKVIDRLMTLGKPELCGFMQSGPNRLKTR